MARQRDMVTRARESLETAVFDFKDDASAADESDGGLVTDDTLMQIYLEAWVARTMPAAAGRRITLGERYPAPNERYPTPFVGLL